ncbi:hypothetical protein ScPMuIL_016362 [Solemya velum]
MAALTVRVTGVARLGRQVPRTVTAVFVQERDKSTAVSSLRRGRGGRSSFSGIVATVFGASGFVGRYVVNKLGKIGSQVIVPYRGDPYDVERLRVSGDIGQVLFFPYDLRDDETIRKAMQHSNVVINLVGRDWETKNFKFNDVNNEGARRIARLARESGVERLIHFSALNASPTPQEIYIKGGSQFLKTKYDGELAVKEEFPDATIFRPADIYGSEDRFLRYYANMWRRGGGHTMPLWKKGDCTVKMPVFVSDVAEGVIQAIQDPDSVGKTYEAVGPHSYYLSDLVDYFYKTMRYRHFTRTVMFPWFRMKVWFMSYAPSRPVFTIEKLEREHITDHVTEEPTLEDLGVKLTRLEHQAPWELKPFRQFAYYDDKLGEFETPTPPPIVA